MSTAVALPPPLVKATHHPLRWLHNKLSCVPWAGVGAYLGVLVIVCLYYLLFELYAPFTNAWHNVVSDSDLRHNIRTVGEGLVGGLLGVALAWNHYRKPRKRHWFDKLEIALHIPNLKDERDLAEVVGSGVRRVIPDHNLAWRILRHVALVIAIIARILTYLALVLLYAAPGFFAALYLSRWIRTETGHVHDTVRAIGVHVHSTAWTKIHNTFTQNWDKKLIGYVSAFCFGRRPIKGVIDDGQLWFAERRVALGKPVRWYHPAPFKARYNEVCAHGAQAAQKRQGAGATIVMMGGVLVVLAMAGAGFYILNYIAS